MKSRRILAAVLAPVCAVSAMAFVASAATQETVLESTATELVSDWSASIQITNNALKTAKAGDTIVLALSGASSAQLQFKDSSWGELPGNADAPGSQSWGGDSYGISLDDGAESYTYTLTEDDVAVVNADGKIIIGGQNVTVESVTLVSAAEDEDSASSADSEDSTPAGDDTSDETPAGDDTSDETPAGDDTSDETPAGDDTSDETPAGDDTSDETPAGDDTSDETPADTSDETSAGDDTSDETPADTSDDTAEPGDTEKAPVVVEADIKDVDSKNGIEGEALEALVLVKDGKKYTWADVESVTFSSDKLFSVQFAANKDVAGVDWFVMGKDKVPAAKEDEAPEWATEWTLGEDELALFDTKSNVKLIGKEDGTNINVKVTMKADAEGKPVANDSDTTSGGNNADTGIALAVAPVILAGAAAAVVAISKKRK